MKTLLLVAFAAVAWAQPDNTITVTASRPLSVQPDQALVSVNVTAPATAGPDNVLGAIAGSGATLNNLTPSYGAWFITTSLPAPSSSWSFLIPTSFDGLKTVLTALAADQQTAQQKNTGFDISFSVSGTQISSALQTAQSCPYTVLFGDAQSQAATVALAAGMRLGEIVGLSDGTDVQQPGAVRSGDFSAFLPVNSYISNARLGVIYTSPVSTPSCTLVAQFRLSAQ